MRHFDALVEDRIFAAMQRGEFENLPGCGKPLPEEDFSMVPEELRMAYRILKNAGFAPPELDLQQQINRLESQMAGEVETGKRQQQAKKLFCLFQQLNDCHQRLMHLSLQEHYYQRILQRLAGAKDKR